MVWLLQVWKVFKKPSITCTSVTDKKKKDVYANLNHTNAGVLDSSHVYTLFCKVLTEIRKTKNVTNICLFQQIKAWKAENSLITNASFHQLKRVL